MNAARFTDEELMAYADGELSEERAAALDLALADDEALADRLGLFIDTRAMAFDALRPMLDEAVPDHLVQHVRDLAAANPAPEPASSVIVFPQGRSGVPIWQLPLAASIALAIGLGGGALLRGPGTNGTGMEIAAVSDPGLTDALAALPAGESSILADGARVEVIATFRAADGSVCREFEVDQSDGTTFVSIACHDGEDWQIRFAIAAAGSDETGYAPASSLEALDAYLGATVAGPPLSAEDEAAVLADLR